MNILKSVVVILGLASLAALSTNSVFTSRATVANNQFSTGLWATPTPSPSPSGSGKVDICHQTGSETNPYVEISISINALPAHLDHGDIYPVPETGCPSGIVGGAAD